MGNNSRYRSALVAVAALAVCMLSVTGAAAQVIPTLSTSFTQDVVVPTGETGATTTVTQDSGLLGAHDDFTVDISFSYGATGTTGPYGIEDPKTYPPGSDTRETAKSIVIDIPPGLIGNPNAIPYEERCDLETFQTSICPDSATVGRFEVDLALFTGPASLLDLATIGKNGVGLTKVSLIKTESEVPAKIGIYVHALSAFEDTRTLLSISPRTEDQLRLRTVTIDDLPHEIYNFPGDEMYDLRIDHMKLTLFGELANGHNFMTNPTNCADWNSQLWANATYVNDNLDSDPLGGGANAFKASNSVTVSPDCSNAGSVPFPVSGGVSIDSPGRDTSPSFDFTINNPGVQGDGQAATSPKRIVTTIPASINVDVTQLGRVCQVADFDADKCPASSRVGTVKIETPLISAGLTGDVYLVKQNANYGLPDLGLRVRGAITFTQRGLNRYVGPKFNQIETTFDEIPQVGFSKLTFHLFGGSDGLLRSLACPTYNKTPAPPTFTYNFTAWSGATASSTTPLNMANCFGIQTLKPYKKCLLKKLPIRPNYQSRVRVKSVVLKIDGKKKATTKKSPFRFNLKIKKLGLKKKRGNKHTLELRATYDDGTLSTKRTTFRTCR